nr:MAG TPA: hypothetical protein [Caudoviricetes sp.]
MRHKNGYGSPKVGATPTVTTCTLYVYHCVCS